MVSGLLAPCTAIRWRITANGFPGMALGKINIMVIATKYVSIRKKSLRPMYFKKGFIAVFGIYS
jgi:hypothetical protein